MKITQVRNATLVIDFGGTRFLVDPVLADKDKYPGFPGSCNDHVRWPTVPLPLTPSEIIDVDAVIVTHTHKDHWDGDAMAQLGKHIPIFTQHEADADILRGADFRDVQILQENTNFRGITLTKTSGRHGSETAMNMAGGRLGEVCGVVFRIASEKVLYLAGDTVWCGEVAEVLNTYRPQVVVLNCGDAQIPGLGSITMGKEDIFQVFNSLPKANLIASHMEAVNHVTLSRTDLRKYSIQTGMVERLYIPEDGETLTF